MDNHTNSKVLTQFYIDHGYKILKFSTSQPKLVHPNIVKRWIVTLVLSELRTSGHPKYGNQSMFSPQTVPHIDGGYSKCV